MKKYKIYIDSNATKFIVSFFLLSLVLWQQVLASPQYIESPFGFHSSYYRSYKKTNELPSIEDIYDAQNPTGRYKNAQDIGVKWERTSAPTPQLPPYNWMITDMNYSSVPVGINILTNIWVRETLFIKPGTWQFIDNRAEHAYMDFVKALVERYDGDGVNDMPGLKNPVKFWQVENEPIINNVSSGSKLNLDWQGFARLVAITYKAVKESDTSAKVLIGGTLGLETFFTDPSVFKSQIEQFYLPIFKVLQGNYIDIFDIHYYGSCGNAQDNWSGSKQAFNMYKKILNDAGYKNIPIWFTESGCPGSPGREQHQAIEIVKRYIFPLSFGVKKIFWAWALVEGYPPLTGTDYFDHTGFIYDGIGTGDPGYGIKKLSYWTYKKMAEILEGSDWRSIRSVLEQNKVYIYQLVKAGKPVWVAWNDNMTQTQITLSGVPTTQIKITHSVPKYQTGQNVTDYSTAFNTQLLKVANGKVVMTLGPIPVFIETVQ